MRRAPDRDNFKDVDPGYDFRAFRNSSPELKSGDEENQNLIILYFRYG